MIRGWFMVRFSNAEVVDWVLERNWGFGKALILFKRWTPIFDAQRERLGEIPMWVPLPSLAPHLWLMDVFKVIGNILGTFLEADMSFQVTMERKMARILVRLDPREGLEEMMQIQVDGYSLTQLLDYEQFPYRCHRCYKHGHLDRDFPLGFRHARKNWVDSIQELQEQPEDVVMEQAISPGRHQA